MITVIASLKGGSGKSTVTFNLAIWLAMANIKIKLFDLDPQLTLTDVVEVRREEAYEPQLVVSSDLEQLKLEKSNADCEVLIDVGTADMKALTTALALADRILIPVPPSQADVWSTQRFLKIIKQSVSQLPEINAFINRADTHHAVRETDEAAAALVTLKNVKLLKNRLGQRTIFRRSFSEGLAVFEMDSRNKASKEFLSLVANLYPNAI